MKISRFSEKAPAETVRLEFNFSKWTSTITSVVSITVEQTYPSTADPDIGSMKEGSSVSVGGRVQQLVKAGLNGYDYQITCTVQAGDQVFVLAGILPVRNFVE